MLANGARDGRGSGECSRPYRDRLRRFIESAGGLADPVDALPNAESCAGRVTHPLKIARPFALAELAGASDCCGGSARSRSSLSRSRSRSIQAGAGPLEWRGELSSGRLLLWLWLDEGECPPPKSADGRARPRFRVVLAVARCTGKGKTRACARASGRVRAGRA